MDILPIVFGNPGVLTPVQECARALLIFAYGLAMVRLIGRRVFGKWAALDIIVSIIIGSNLSRALTGNAPLAGTIAGTTVVFAVHWALAQAAARSPTWSRWIEGRPTELARDGAPIRENLRRWCISEADVNEALRQRGTQTLDETALLLLEPSGAISVVRRAKGPDGL